MLIRDYNIVHLLSLQVLVNGAPALEIGKACVHESSQVDDPAVAVVLDCTNIVGSDNRVLRELAIDELRRGNPGPHHVLQIRTIDPMPVKQIPKTKEKDTHKCDPKDALVEKMGAFSYAEQSNSNQKP